MGQTLAELCPLSEAAAAHHGPFRPLRVSDAQLVCCNWVMLPTLGVKLERHRKTDVSQRNVAALQRQAAANQIMAILPRGCRAALPKACRAKTPCRVSVVAVTVRAAGASGTWDIYSQIASRLKSLQARYAADHCRHVDHKVSFERLGEEPHQEAERFLLSRVESMSRGS